LKINIEESKGARELEVTIKCDTVNVEVERLISVIELHNHTITGKAKGKTVLLKPQEILYFDTVDEKVFIYTNNMVYETGLRLYEIEEKFESTSIVRVSKSAILNLMKVDQVAPMLNGRIKATLQNGETIIISRQYVSIFKKKLGI
jgi:DNA-binding LytR/AlgR family response regulator